MTLRRLWPAAIRYLGLRSSQYAARSALEALARHRLEKTLQAAQRIPFYRARLDSQSGPADFAGVPILKRSEIPALSRSVRESVGAGPVFHDNSSGSNGMPVEFLFDANHQSGRYAARYRFLHANGWNPLRRTTWILATTSRDDESTDSRLRNSRLRMRSAFPGVIFRPFDEQVETLRATRPEFFYTMPSNLDGLLQAFERRALRLGALRLIFSGGEVLEDSLRERARRILGVEIRDNYGSTEAFVAWQCPAARYHINAEHVVVEVVDSNDRPVAPGAMGRILITTLENHLMPLIRYEIGDYAIASDERCPCGRTLPTIGKIVGRGINLFRMPDGRRVSPWPLVGPLKARSEIRQFQIVQETQHRYRVRYVCDRELDAAVREEIRASFAAILGIDAELEFDRVESIARTAGGKFMTALSNLTE